MRSDVARTFASTAPRLVGELRALADEDPEHADEQESEFSRARADVQALQDQLALLEMKSLRLQEHLVDLQARLNTARGERPEAGALLGVLPGWTQEAEDGTIHIAYTYQRRTIKVTAVTEAWVRAAEGPLCQ